MMFKKFVKLIIEIIFYAACINFLLTACIDAWKNEELTQMQIFKRTPQHFFWNFKK